MPMNGNQLGQEIADAVMASNASSEARAEVLEFYRRIATAIVEHIVTNAKVLPNEEGTFPGRIT